ncbi:MAG: 50S ribosomal protein L29 [Mycoplasmataceae bacterium]|jgi:large subunit ribosomal protein L29|nr:50S ribosomal protein L29 [Mycoplasmataceae bacterium]
MGNINKELKQKTNEELCSLIMRLKLQLLEARFKMASGELEKVNQLQEIRKTIARAMTILTQRHIDLTIGTHGITMYNRETKEVKSITDSVQQALQIQGAKKHVVDAAKNITANEIKKDEEKAATPIIKKELKSHMDKKVEKQIIRKTVGGGA